MGCRPTTDVSFSGAAAVNRVLGELGSGWVWLASAYRVAPIRWAEDWPPTGGYLARFAPVVLEHHPV